MRFHRGLRSFGKRRLDATVQRVVDTSAEIDWMIFAEDRGVWDALKPLFAQQVLRRSTPQPALPRHRHYVRHTDGISGSTA